MAYILNSTTIRSPHSFSESNNTQMAQNRTLDGSINRDHFGDNKRTWTLEYQNVTPSDYNTIKGIYDSYLTDSQAKTFEITETNYTISETNVHVDLVERGFSIRGTSYISDFSLVLTEA